MFAIYNEKEIFSLQQLAYDFSLFPLFQDFQGL